MSKYRCLVDSYKNFDKGVIYAGGDMDSLSRLTVAYYANKYPTEWSYVADSEPVSTTTFEAEATVVLDNLKKMLVDKNRKYGNSALEPVRVFSKCSAEEQLKVRIDDKLSRLISGQNDEDEDVIDDLLGYLVLLKMSNNDKQRRETI